MIKYTKIVTIVTILVPLFWSGGTSAFSLPGLISSGDPAFVNYVNIKYQRADAQSYKLTVEAKRIDGSFYMSGAEYMVDNLSYKLRANYDIDGAFIPDGSTVRINGNLSDFGANGVLFEANLTKFEYTPTIIGFNTEITSCAAGIAAYCTTNESVYLYDFGGDFSTDLKKFRANGMAITTIPVPAAVWLFGSGLLGLVSFAKRKKVAA